MNTPVESALIRLRAYVGSELQPTLDMLEKRIEALEFQLEVAHNHMHSKQMLIDLKQVRIAELEQEVEKLNGDIDGLYEDMAGASL